MRARYYARHIRRVKMTGGSISPEAEGRSRRRRAQCGVRLAASSQTDPQPPLCSRGSVAPRRTSNRRFTGDCIRSSSLRRGATEPPRAQPSPKLLADAKGAQRAECPRIAVGVEASHLKGSLASSPDELVVPNRRVSTPCIDIIPFRAAHPQSPQMFCLLFLDHIPHPTQHTGRREFHR